MRFIAGCFGIPDATLLQFDYAARTVDFRRGYGGSSSRMSYAIESERFRRLQQSTWIAGVSAFGLVPTAIRGRDAIHANCFLTATFDTGFGFAPQ